MGAYTKVVPAAIVSGILLALALPLGEHGWIAWFAFVPVIAAVRERRLILGALAAILTLATTGLLAYWGVIYRYRSPGDPIYIVGACGKFAFILIIVLAVGSEPRSWRRPAWWFAALAVLAEAAQLLDLPEHIALTQYRNLGMLQVASFGGIWLVSFLIWWSNFALARMRLPQLVASAVGLVAGATILSHVGARAPGPLQRLAVVQVADPDEDKLRALQRDASALHPEFVVWPEFAGIPMSAHGEADLKRLSSDPGVSPFVTTFEDDNRPLPHNVAALFSQGRESARYAKRKPFGGEKSMHAAGDRPVAVSYADGVVGMCICFDSCFPDIVVQTARLPGVDVIAVPTVDPPTANYFMTGMHQAYIPFRCAESGIAIVRSDGAAFSQIVDSSGRIVAERGPGDGVLTAWAPVGRSLTGYRLLGDWFLWACGGLFVVGVLVKWKPLATASRHLGLIGPEQPRDGTADARPTTQ